MKKMNWLSGLLAVMMVVSMMTGFVLPASAAEADCSNGHTVVIDEEIPALCEDPGYTAGSHCSVCGQVIKAQQEIPALGHNLEYFDSKLPTFTRPGWNAYEDCTRCAYTTYVEIPMLDVRPIEDYETFVLYLSFLEELAFSYANEVPGVDPLNLVIKYIRTGVDRYNSGSWGIMAGYEDADFAKYVADVEDMLNSELTSPDEMVAISSLKDIKNFTLPNGDVVDFGHMFGTMDITYHNNFGENHADVGGWSGDLVDLLEFADYGKVSGDLEEMVAEITADYLGKNPPAGSAVGSFNITDIYGDLDAFYLMDQLKGTEYEMGMLSQMIMAYCTEDLSDEDRAAYLLNHRLDGVTLRTTVREAVYNAYTGNKVIATLEGTREFQSKDLTALRKAVCYAFADYLCKLAGDYVEVTENPYLTPFSVKTSILAPGITQEIKQATAADGKQMVYYIATADINRDDVNVYANYRDNDPTTWGMATVLEQAKAAQNKYGDPESEHYIENYNVIASTNGAGYNMATGEPSGLLVMGGKEYQGINSGGFFGILKDGTAVIGTTEEYNTIYKDQVKEGIAGFGYTLIEDGKIVATDKSSRASRTAVGITRTGKVVLMVLDGRQEPISCGGNIVEIAQIMLDAGCVEAVNLDGGGSTTYVAKQEGAEELAVVNKPSDGTARSVSTSLIMVSTAPSSTAFDHAVLKSDYDYMTVGSSMQIVAEGVSATGNAAELPEGITWEVSNTRWGSITEDGVFTAKRFGSVDVNLLLGDTVIGTKTINIVTPEKVYFSRTDIDAVYGQKTALPVVALYQNKPVAILESDVVFTISNPKAGVIEGFSFTGNEASGIKNLEIYVALAADSSATAALKIALYKQGEATFDFDQATGGNRQFAWYREVSNSITEDNTLYEIVDPAEDMVTSYTFAIDMTQIPIPGQLNDLIYMLPGAGEEGASAWTFLCQLAERISVLSTVEPVIYFDDDFEVDYSNLTLVNEYFELTDTIYNEEDNSLRLVLNWIDQTKAIDATMANPLCIVSGVKLTPKADAKWGENGRLIAVNTGKVGYEIYMRANALYSFSQKPDNQATYGLYPYINPNDPVDKGGYFSGTYAELEDTYTLVKTLRNGWINETGGFAYYVDGVKYTGVKAVDGVYYDFGENGINAGQTEYTGLFLDEDAGVYRYAKLGALATGWQMIGTEWYYFDPATKAAVTGTFEYTNELTYEMDETGKLVKGCWKKCIFGTRYYYGPSFHKKGWQIIDGNRYYFHNSYRYEGFRCVQESNSKNFDWYDFGTDGICKAETIPDGFYTDADGSLSYVVGGLAQKGLHKIDGAYYFFDYYGHAVVGTKYADTTHCDLRTGVYTFGEDYKAVNGLQKQADGKTYYYVNGQPKQVGLIQIDGDYYFVGGAGGTIIVDQEKYVWQGNGLLPESTYAFGPDGKMLNGIVERDGALYYYENGKSKQAGLIEVDGAYYFVGGSKGEITMNESKYVWKSNGLLPESTYAFGPDGKMLNGIVEKDGVLCYYVQGKPKQAGLIEIDGAYYFAGGAMGEVTVNKVQYIWKSNGLLPAANYEFGPDGKMLNGIVEKNGVLLYYSMGNPKTAGLVEVDGAYYFAAGSRGEVVVNATKYVWQGNGLLPEATYEFGPDGKMLDGIVDKDGVLYYYVNGQPKTAGLVEIDGDYYFAGGSKGELTLNSSKYVWQGNGLLPEATYEFGPDGKMLDGIVEKEGVLYYYVQGKPKQAGLIEIDGDYYFAGGARGELSVNKTQYIWKSNGLLPEANYEFDAEGKMVNGFFEKNGVRYYYENGKPAKVGLNYVDGYYYFVKYDGSLIVNQSYYTWETNGLSVQMTYIFNELGQVIG